MSSRPDGDMRVVVADDEPIMQMYLEETVALLGMDVVGVACDGRELVEECRKSCPDLIVTDIRMPNLDGYSAVEEICREGPMPVLFISGFDEMQRLESAQSYCIPTYLMKPVDEEGLQRGINVVLERFRHFRRILQDEPNSQKALLQFRRVEQAVARISRKGDLEEDQAFDRILLFAEQHGIPLAEAADRMAAGEGPPAA